MSTQSKATIRLKGGPGSGFHGHAGIPGHQGGSQSDSVDSIDVSQMNRHALDTHFADPRMDTIFTAETPAIYGPDNHYWHDANIAQKSRLKDKIVSNLSKETGVSYDEVNRTIEQWAQSSNDTAPASISLQEAASEEFGIPLSDWQNGNMDVLDNAKQEYTTFQKTQEMLPEATKFYYDSLDSNTNASPADREALWQELHPGAPELYSIINNSGKWNYVYPITSRDNERKILRQVYNDTQERLKNYGLNPDDEIQIYRGINTNPFRPDVGSVVNYKGNVIESWSISHKVAYQFPNHTFATKVKVRDIFSLATTGFGCLTEGEIIVFGGHVKKAKVAATNYG